MSRHLAMQPWLDLVPSGCREVIADTLHHFERLHMPQLARDPCEGVRILFRGYRGAAMVAGSGAVKTTELFHIRNLEAFESDPEERRKNIAEVSWTNLGSILCALPPVRTLRGTATVVDYDGANLGADLNRIVRQFEGLLGAHGPAPDEILGDGRNGTYRPLVTELREAFCEHYHAAALPLYVAGATALRDSLQRDRIDVFGRAGARSVQEYNWLLGLERRTANVELGLRRTQAVTAYPIAWSVIMEPLTPVSLAVEEAKPLAPKLAHRLGISESALRLMNGLGSEGAGERGIVSPDRVRELASQVVRMPDGRRPSSAYSWQRFFSAVRVVNILESGRIGVARQLGDSLLKTMSGQWDDRDIDLAIAEAGVRDMMLTLHTRTFAPAALHYRLGTWTPNHTLALLTQNRTMKQFCAGVREWHVHQEAINEDMRQRFGIRSSVADACWLPLVDKTVELVHDITAVELTSQEGLDDEHRRMSHCVNGYTSYCLFGDTHIVSFRTSGGVAIATAELKEATLKALVASGVDLTSRDIRELPPGVRQFRGVSNANPPAAAYEALWKYVAGIASKQLKVDFESLELLRDQRRAMRAATGGASDAAVINEPMLRAVWEMHGFLMSRSMRKASRTEQGLRDTLQKTIDDVEAMEVAYREQMTAAPTIDAMPNRHLGHRASEAPAIPEAGLITTHRMNRPHA